MPHSMAASGGSAGSGVISAWSLVALKAQMGGGIGSGGRLIGQNRSPDRSQPIVAKLHSRRKSLLLLVFKNGR